MADREELLAEADVLDRWPALSKSSLRTARQQGRISWVKGKRGSAWYRASAVEKFIEKRLEQPCHDQDQSPSSKSEGTGLRESRTDQDFIITGMTQELEERAARSLARTISKKPNKCSRG